MLITLSITTGLIILSVMIHYETLEGLARLFQRVERLRHRRRIVLGVAQALVAHTLEILLFSLGYYGLHSIEGSGELVGNFNGSFSDCVYFSFVAYTTLGFGDIIPGGPLRWLAGMEALTGLVLIAWTASFLYVQIQNHWESG